MIQWPARVKVVLVSENILTGMLTEGAVVDAMRCVEGLPEGAQMVMASYNEKRKALAIYFEHPTWPLASPGSVPTLKPVLTTAEPEVA